MMTARHPEVGIGMKTGVWDTVDGSMEEQIFMAAESDEELRNKLLDYATCLHEGAMETGDLLLFIQAETLRERVLDLVHESRVREELGPTA